MTLLAAQTNGTFGPYMGLIYIAIIGLGFYFLIIKPGKKQREQFKEMVDGMKVGDEVVTRSGIKGKVVSVDDVYFTLETGNGAEIEFILNALGYIVTPIDGQNNVDEAEGEKEVPFKSYDDEEDNLEEK